MSDASPFMRKKMAKETEVLDDEMQSRYDKIHGAIMSKFNIDFKRSAKKKCDQRRRSTTLE